MVVQIKEILEKMIGENPGMPRAFREFRIATAWEKVNPPNIAKYSSPEKLVGGVLYVNAANSSWAQQINLLKPEIMMNINRFMGEKAISDIRLKTGFRNEAVAKKAREIKICIVCSVEHSSDEEMCPACFRQKKAGNEIDLLRLVEKDPKLTAANARETMPDISDVDLHRAKRDVMARKADKNMRERRQNGWKKAN